MSVMNVVFSGPDRSTATIRARGVFLGNLLVLTQSWRNVVKFDIDVEYVRRQFGAMINAPLPMSFTLKTLDKGDIILDAEGYMELAGVLAVMVAELDISAEDLEMYKPE